MGFFDFLDPGPNGRDSGPSPQIQAWEDYDINNLQFDSGGFPVGPKGPPSAKHGLHVQFEAERATEQRRNNFFADALNTMRGGSRVLESYRPGGAALLRSGLVGQTAGLQFNMGMAQRTPDMLSDFRRDHQAKADIEARKAARINTVLGVINAAAGVVGAATGGGGGGQQAQVEAPSQETAGQVQAQGGLSAIGQQAVGPSTAPAQLSPGAEAPTPMSGPGGSAMASSMEGGGPASGGASPSPGGSGGKQGGGASPSPGGGPMGAGMPPSGGYGNDGIFSQTALAAAGTRVDPLVERIVTINHAQNLDPSFWEAADYSVGRLLEHAMASVE